MGTIILVIYALFCVAFIAFLLCAGTLNKRCDEATDRMLREIDRKEADAAKAAQPILALPSPEMTLSA